MTGQEIETRSIILLDAWDRGLLGRHPGEMSEADKDAALRALDALPLDIQPIAEEI